MNRNLSHNPPNNPSSRGGILDSNLFDGQVSENIDDLLRNTLEKLGFVFPEKINKNEALVGEQERSHLLAYWRKIYTDQLRNIAISLALATKIKENPLGIASEKIIETMESLISISVAKMEWLLDHRHIIGLFNDQCNARRLLPTELTFTNNMAAEKNLNKLTSAGYDVSASKDSDSVLRVKEAIYIAPTGGRSSYDNHNMPVVRLIEPGQTVKIQVEDLQSVVAQAPDRKYGFFHPLINCDGSRRSEELVITAYQLFNPYGARTNNILSDSQGFTIEKGL